MDEFIYIYKKLPSKYKNKLAFKTPVIGMDYRQNRKREFRMAFIETKTVANLRLAENVVVDVSCAGGNENADATCSSLGENSQAYGLGSTVYTDNGFAYGENAVAGTRVFRLVSGDMEEKSWTLKTVAGLEPGMEYSVRLLNNYTLIGKITRVDPAGRKIFVDGMPPVSKNTRLDETLNDPYLHEIGSDLYEDEIRTLRGHAGYSWVYIDSEGTSRFRKTSEIPEGFPVFDDYDADINTIWILGHPDLGDISSYSTAAMAFGSDSHAAKQYSFAEGAGSIAHGKYSHAEGIGTIAGYAAHAQGINTKALGINSFTAGLDVSAVGSNSICMGAKSSGGHDGTFTWGGNGFEQVYESHGIGSFNVNPLGGAGGFYIGNQRIQDALHVGEVRDFMLDSVEFESSEVLSDLQADFQIQPDVHGYISYRGGRFQPLADVEYGIASFDVENGQMLEISSKTNWEMGIVAYDENGNFIDSWHHDKMNKNLFNYIPDRLFDPKTNGVVGLRIIVPLAVKKFSISHLSLFKADGSLNQKSGLVVRRGAYRTKTGVTIDQIEKTVDSKLDARLGEIENVVDEILGE